MSKDRNALSERDTTIKQFLIHLVFILSVKYIEKKPCNSTAPDNSY